MAATILPTIFLLQTFLCLSWAQLRLVEPMQDVAVTEGNKAEFVCAVEGRSSDQQIIWFLHNQTADAHCDIDASPSRTISIGDLKCHDNLSFTRLKGTNGRQKTYEIFHVYCVFYSGFMCQTTVIFVITKDGSLVLTTLAS